MSVLEVPVLEVPEFDLPVPWMLNIREEYLGELTLGEPWEFWVPQSAGVPQTWEPDPHFIHNMDTHRIVAGGPLTEGAVAYDDDIVNYWLTMQVAALRWDGPTLAELGIRAAQGMRQRLDDDTWLKLVEFFNQRRDTP